MLLSVGLWAELWQVCSAAASTVRVTGTERHGVCSVLGYMINLEAALANLADYCLCIQFSLKIPFVTKKLALI